MQTKEKVGCRLCPLSMTFPCLAAELIRRVVYWNRIMNHVAKHRCPGYSNDHIHRVEIGCGQGRKTGLSERGPMTCTEVQWSQETARTKVKVSLSCSLAEQDQHLKCHTSGFKIQKGSRARVTSWPGDPHRCRGWLASFCDREQITLESIPD